MKHSGGIQVSLLPPFVVNPGQGYAATGGGVDEGVVAGVDGRVGYETAGFVCLYEEEEISRLQVARICNDYAVPGLFLGAAGYSYAVVGESPVEQAGAVHALRGDTAHAVGRTQVSPCGSYDGIRGYPTRIKGLLDALLSKMVKPLHVGRAEVMSYLLPGGGTTEGMSGGCCR